MPSNRTVVAAALAVGLMISPLVMSRSASANSATAPVPSAATGSAPAESAGATTENPNHSTPPKALGNAGLTRAVPNQGAEMPDGPLKACTYTGYRKPKTYENTSKVTSITIDSDCAKAKQISDWTGWEFLPKLQKVTFKGLTEGITAPTGGLVEVLPTVTELTIDSSNKAPLPKFGDMHNMTSLSLTASGFTTLPADLNMTQLKKLSLSGNSFTAFPDGLKMENLEEISLDKNNLSDLTVTAGTELPKLKKLSAANNKINKVNLSGLPVLSTLAINGNRISGFTDLKGVSTAALNLADNAITSFAGVRQVKVEQTLDLGYNQISDLTDIGEVSEGETPGLTVNMTHQNITYPDMPAGQPQSLGDLIKLPDGVVLEWSAGSDNMAAVNAETQKFTASKTGKWRLSWKVDKTKTGAHFLNDVKLNYAGNASGNAVEGTEVTVSIKMPDPIAYEGKPAEMKAEYSGVSDVKFQWYKAKYQNGSGKQLIAGATTGTISFDEVAATDGGAFYRVVVLSDAGEFASDFAEFRVQPRFADPNFEKCVQQTLRASSYSTTELQKISVISCPNMNIKSLEDIKLLKLSKYSDFSNNQISDLAPLMRGSSENVGSLN